jgi:diadenosine tetraphosphate (Ap4A) HIT family hydrolase
MSKIKILLVGSVQGHVRVLVDKLKALQSSKAGPFDVCFCVGSFLGEGSDPEALKAIYDEIPLPVYLQEYSGPVDSEASSENIVQLAPNLFYLLGSKDKDHPAANLYPLNVPNHSESLLVASCPPQVRVDALHCKPLLEKCQEGCDLLLTDDWPQGMEDILQVDASVSYDISEVAMKCRPRYHVAASQQYHQSPAYQLPQQQIGRFIALASVVPGKTSKTNKYIHALGVAPLRANPTPPATSALPCPFVTTKAEPTTAPSSNNAPPSFVPPPPQESFSRFQTNKRSRGDDNDEQPSLEPPDDPSISTLFLYGLHKDVTGELQSTTTSIVLLHFEPFGITLVRHPPSSSTSTYCFLEFPTQQDALKCLLDCQGRVKIKGVPLTVKWASHSKKTKTTEKVQHYVTHDEAPNSTTLYFHPPPEGDMQGEDNPFAENVRLFMEKVLEHALNEGNEEDERVTAETEPALKVEVRTKDAYGFLQFASHAAATMALAASTTSTDGGTIVEAPENAPKPSAELVGTLVRWAKGAPKKSEQSNFLEALGLERKHFPPDARKDCWFCLASPTCEKHMITSIYDECYATLPKGPVHQGHVLVVPVTHSSQGAWTQPCAKEVNLVKEKLQRHASQAYDSDLFVFERAMETKGGYHTHVQCVPIPRGLTTKLQATMMAHAQACGFELRTVQSDLGIQAMISDEDNYFYAEICGDRQTHRFVYKAEEGQKVPLQFGREVLASVLNKPDLAHWKSCLLDKDQETEFAAEFRKSFGAFES